VQVYFDSATPWAFQRKQTFTSVPIEVKDTRVVRAVELLRDAEFNISTIQDEHGHLEGDALEIYSERCEKEISELIRKLRNLRNINQHVTK